MVALATATVGASEAAVCLADAFSCDPHPVTNRQTTMKLRKQGNAIEFLAEIIGSQLKLFEPAFHRVNGEAAGSAPQAQIRAPVASGSDHSEVPSECLYGLSGILRPNHHDWRCIVIAGRCAPIRSVRPFQKRAPARSILPSPYCSPDFALAAPAVSFVRSRKIHRRPYTQRGTRPLYWDLAPPHAGNLLADQVCGAHSNGNGECRLLNLH
jgi:hypothetical protein